MGHKRRRDEDLDEALHEVKHRVIGEQQVFSIDEARIRGVSKDVIRALLTSGRLHKIRHGAYVESTVWNEAQGDPLRLRRLILSAAMIGLRGPAYAYGEIAAELHGLPIQRSGPASLVIVRPQGHDLRSANTRLKARNRFDDVRIIGRDLSDEGVVRLHGIPSIGLASAALTSAACFRREYAVGVFDAALAQRVTHDEILRTSPRWQAGKGITAASRLVELARPGAESILESVSRVRLMDRGVPEPILQHSFSDDRGFVGRVDMWWPEFDVVGEADGMGKYNDIRDVRAEKVREDRLRALGLTVVRWTWEEIWSTPQDVVSRIRGAHHRRAA